MYRLEFRYLNEFFAKQSIYILPASTVTVVLKKKRNLKKIEVNMKWFLVIKRFKKIIEKVYLKDRKHNRENLF